MITEYKILSELEGQRCPKCHVEMQVMDVIPLMPITGLDEDEFVYTCPHCDGEVKVILERARPDQPEAARGVRDLERNSPMGPPCPQCGDKQVAATWSEHVNERRIRYVWTCDACEYEFETTVQLRRCA